MSQYLNTIQKLAGPAVKTAGVGDNVVSDLIKGAQNNPRLGNVQLDAAGCEQKLAAAGVTPLEIAKLAGALTAFAEAECTFKEASEALGVPEVILSYVVGAVG